MDAAIRHTLSPHAHFLPALHQPSNHRLIYNPIHDIAALCVFVLDPEVPSCECVGELARLLSQVGDRLVDH